MATKVVFVVLALLLSVAYGVSAENLYPSCSGSIRETTAASTKSTELLSLGEYTAITIRCLAFEVLSVPSDDGTDHCLIEHQTKYPYQFAVIAQSSANGENVTEKFDIRDVESGSIARVTLRPQQRSRFTAVFTNLSPNSKCTLKLRALITTDGHDEAVQSSVPSLVAADPPTIYGSNGATTYFVLRYPSASDAKSSMNDVIFLSQGSTMCDGTRKYLDTHPQLPANVVLSESDRGLYVTRRYHFGTDDGGMYTMCSIPRGGSEAVSVARVNVFGGNPAYYEIVAGANADGSIYGGVPITMKFYGHDLDTRPNGDRAKFVVDTESCETGLPAAGVPIETDLGPEDDYGPNTTYTLWTFVIRYGGVFRVCYHRKSGNSWTEVPSIEEVGPGEATTRAPETNVPTPTDPVTKKACDMAPAATEAYPWKQYAGVRVTLLKAQTSSHVRRELADAFCVPRAGLAIERITKSKEGNTVVYVSIDCEGDVADGATAACSSNERYNYLAYLAKANGTMFEHHGVAKWEVLTGILVGDDTVVTVMGKGGIFFICLTIVGVAVGLAYAKVKYDERREYFVQFGMDDGDMDDMYETGAIPFSMGGESEDVYGYEYHGDDGQSGGGGRSTGRGAGGRGGGRPASHIGDALIEIEE